MAQAGPLDIAFAVLAAIVAATSNDTVRFAAGVGAAAVLVIVFTMVTSGKPPASLLGHFIHTAFAEGAPSSPTTATATTATAAGRGSGQGSGARKPAATTPASATSGNNASNVCDRPGCSRPRYTGSKYCSKSCRNIMTDLASQAAGAAPRICAIATCSKKVWPGSQYCGKRHRDQAAKATTTAASSAT